jgi:hypothetical protein
MAHACRLDASSYPISDYLTDLKSVLDQGVRILQAMVDIAADYLCEVAPTLAVITTVLKCECRSHHPDYSLHASFEIGCMAR